MSHKSITRFNYDYETWSDLSRIKDDISFLRVYVRDAVDCYSRGEKINGAFHLLKIIEMLERDIGKAFANHNHRTHCEITDNRVLGVHERLAPFAKFPNKQAEEAYKNKRKESLKERPE